LDVGEPYTPVSHVVMARRSAMRLISSSGVPDTMNNLQRAWWRSSNSWAPGAHGAFTTASSTNWA